MDWRESFFKFCGPGLLGGITFGQWCALWRRRDLQFGLSRAPRMLTITSQSVKNSILKRVEREIRRGMGELARAAVDQKLATKEPDNLGAKISFSLFGLFGDFQSI